MSSGARSSACICWARRYRHGRSLFCRLEAESPCRVGAFGDPDPADIRLAAHGDATVLAAFTVKSAETAVASGTTAGATAKCAQDEHVGFGGFKGTVSASGTLYNGGWAFPIGLTSEGTGVNRLKAKGAGGGSGGGTITAIAYCTGGNLPKVVKNSKLMPAGTCIRPPWVPRVPVTRRWSRAASAARRTTSSVSGCRPSR